MLSKEEVLMSTTTFVVQGNQSWPAREKDQTEEAKLSPCCQKKIISSETSQQVCSGCNRHVELQGLN
jgi:hypothetical protein